jgi:RHS repeat-associated protein
MIYNAPIIDRTLEPRVTQSLACAPAGSADVATDPLLWSTVFRPLSEASQANELHGYFSMEPQEIANADHSNQQYSVTAVTTSSGAIAERYAYSAYGEPTVLNASGSALASSAINNRYSYTGREWDTTVGLYHFRARWMSPKAGRFLTRDPIGYGGQDRFLLRFLSTKDQELGRIDSVREDSPFFSRRGKPFESEILVNSGLYTYVQGGVLNFSDPTGNDRYWIGGTNPGDHSTICVDEYDSAGRKSSVYCCTIGVGSGDNGCGGNGSGIVDGFNWCCSFVGISFYGMKVTCGSFPSVAAWNAGLQTVTTYSSNPSEDDKLIKRMKKENGMTWLWNGPMNSCHNHVGGRCSIGLKKPGR